MRKIYLALCFLFSTAIAVGWTEEPITIRRSGVIYSRMANTAIAIRTEKHPDNRELDLICESEDFYTRSTESLDGVNTPIEKRFEMSLSSGKYECIATLTRNTNDGKKTFTASTRFFIA